LLEFKVGVSFGHRKDLRAKVAYPGI
jgi:hypothetical protein